jgi:hypothetical protein
MLRAVEVPMAFRITGLDPAQFRDLFTMTAGELAARRAVRKVVDSHPGYPCRVSLEDAQIGEEVVLLPYEHHDADSPYRGAGPIYVRREATRAYDGIDAIPPVLERRLLSVRAYDGAGMMLGAEVCRGAELPEVISRLFADEQAAYLHVHNAKPGCFACRIDRH